MNLNKRQLASWRRQYRIFGIIAIFAVPLTIILILQFMGEPHVKELPYYGPKNVSASGDTTYHRVPPFQLRSHQGHPYAADSLRGKIHIAYFFFANCPGICPKMTANMAKMQKEIKDFPDVRIVGYSIDPERDSVEALAAYAQQYDLAPRLWELLTGSAETIYGLASNGYLLTARHVNDPNAPGSEDGFFHENKCVLVDKNLRLRGYYRIIDDAQGRKELDRLVKEVKALRAWYRYDAPAEESR